MLPQDSALGGLLLLLVLWRMKMMAFPVGKQDDWEWPHAACEAAAVAWAAAVEDAVGRC